PAAGYRDSGRCAPPPAPPRRCRWQRSGFWCASGFARPVRAAGSRANRPPRRWRSPAPTRGSCRRALCRRQAWHPQLLQGLERLRIAEKIGDADQEVAKKRVDLAGVLAQALDVGRERLDLQNLHAPFDAAKERAAFVAAEIVAGLVEQNGADRLTCRF